MLFCIGWVVATLCVVRFSLCKQPALKWLPFALAAYFLLNPYFWIEIPWFGHFDIFVALACLGALHYRMQDRDRISGTLLAIGTLLKIFPVVMLPFLLIDGRRLRIRLGAWYLLFTGVGLLVAWLMWGTWAFYPYRCGTSREPSFLSIFAFLAGPYSILHVFHIADNANSLAMPLLAIAGLTVFTACYHCKIDYITGSILALLTTLTFYKLGHPQFQMVLFVLIPYWYVKNWQQLSSRISLHLICGCYLGWISEVVVLYISSELQTDVGRVLLHAGGVPTFVLALATIVVVLMAGLSLRPPREQIGENASGIAVACERAIGRAA
jgi:hypothetical protein